jgi:hypothetical protein
VAFIACVELTLILQPSICEHDENLFLPAPEPIIGWPGGEVMLLAVDNGMFDQNPSFRHLSPAIAYKTEEFERRDPIMVRT